MRPLGTVLVIDDDENTTRTFARALQLKGLNVVTAPNGRRGLEEASATELDAIILDLRMPLMDGINFLRHLRMLDQHRAVPVALVTGDYLMSEGIESELRVLGAEVHFKPIWLEDLVQVTFGLLKLDPLVSAAAQ